MSEPLGRSGGECCRAVCGERALPASPLQSQVTEENSLGQRHRSLVKGRAAGKENICKLLCQGDWGGGGVVVAFPCEEGSPAVAG